MSEMNNSDDYECNHRSVSESSSIICLQCYMEPKVIAKKEENNMEEHADSDSCCDDIAQAKAAGFQPIRFRRRKETE
jgi:hypothetical protein